MTRSGTLIVLGAGASADAGYPMAATLLDLFVSAVDDATADDERSRASIISQLATLEAERSDDPDQIFIPMFDERRTGQCPTLREAFDELWKHYEAATIGVPQLGEPPVDGGGSAVFETRTGVQFAPWAFPHYADSSAPTALEGFFAYFDKLLDPELRGAPEDGVVSVIHHLRRLRSIAIEVAYAALRPSRGAVPTYLSPLLDLDGPGQGHPTVLTLNFDLALEAFLADTSTVYSDGFSSDPDAKASSPPTCGHPNRPASTTRSRPTTSPWTASPTT